MTVNRESNFTSDAHAVACALIAGALAASREWSVKPVRDASGEYTNRFEAFPNLGTTFSNGVGPKVFTVTIEEGERRGERKW